MPYPASISRSKGSGRANSVPGTGTITQLGTTLTGTSTLFSTQVRVGDRLVGGAINGKVTVITSDVLITVDSSATVGVGVAFAILTG